MSTRHFQRLLGKNVLPPPEDSDCEFEPLYNKNSGKSLYDGLEVKSDSESEEKFSSGSEEDEEEEEEAIQLPKKNKNNKKKRRCQTKKSELNEIGNFMRDPDLDKPGPSSLCLLLKLKDTIEDPEVEILKIEQKYLNADNEFRKLFGSDSDDEKRRKPQRTVHLKKCLLFKLPSYAPPFKQRGLSMSIHSEDKGWVNYVFNHNEEYQEEQTLFFLTAYLKSVNPDLYLPLEEAFHMHVEYQMEIIDTMYRIGQHQAAYTLLEYTLACLQRHSHPCFNFTKNVRLDYAYLENRPFHICLLKYAYLVSSKACHRTALEITKSLLKLDPSDPIAVITVIDIFALKSKEYQWLIKAIDHWAEKRDASYLFNMKYSYALAHFHVARKNKADISYATSLLKNAILHYPTVVKNIFTMCGRKSLVTHKFFKDAEDTTANNLSNLIYLYASLTLGKWNEKVVLKWLIEVLAEVIKGIDSKDQEIQEELILGCAERRCLFRRLPLEVIRHLHIVEPLTGYLMDEASIQMPRTQAWDPAPRYSKTYNRYKYARLAK